MGLQSTCLAAQGWTLWGVRRGTKEKIVKDTSSPISWKRSHFSLCSAHEAAGFHPSLLETPFTPCHLCLTCIVSNSPFTENWMTLQFHFIASFCYVICLSQVMHSYGPGKQSSTNFFLHGTCAWVQMATHCTKQRSDNAEQQEPLSLAHILQQRWSEEGKLNWVCPFSKVTAWRTLFYFCLSPFLRPWKPLALCRTKADPVEGTAVRSPLFI